jgi:hypothetical protein
MCVFIFIMTLCACALRSGITVAVTHRGLRIVLKWNRVAACKRLITHGVHNLIKLTENANCIVILRNELYTTTNLFCGLSWLFTYFIRNAKKKKSSRVAWFVQLWRISDIFRHGYYSEKTRVRVHWGVAFCWQGDSHIPYILWHIRFSLVTWSMHHTAFP